MLRLYARYRTTIVGFFVLVAPLVLLWYHGKPRSAPTAYERVLLRFTSPAQTLMGDVIGAVRMVWTDYIWVVNVQKENRELRTVNEELVGMVQDRERLEKENRRLKALLKFKGERPDLVTIAARVVAKDVSPFHRILKLRISAGADHGVRRYQAVITPRGVVGYIHKTVGGYAEVKLAVDAGSRISVSVRDREIKGVVVGSGDRNTFVASFETTQIQNDIHGGEWLVTNGEDERFPKGLAVGRLDQNPPTREEAGLRYGVTPAANFSTLEFVLIVTSQVEQIPSMEGP